MFSAISVYRATKKESFILAMMLLSLLVRLLAIGSTNLIAEEAYYWNYANHLDIGYLDHPPMVAFLIKCFTLVFGTNEFGVRISSIVCWCVCALFSYKLTEQIRPGSGKNALFLLAILPFFFIHSLIITPDLPLIACWSAALYYLHAALILNKEHAWYSLGLWIGLGMLSKYTIALLAPATLLYLITIQDARRWFFRAAPYLCLCLIFILFLPVIYWNATHDWASFLFQTSRRLQETDSFSFHELLGLCLFFLTPVGAFELARLFNKKAVTTAQIDKKTQRFIQLFTLTPLVIFSLFSLIHEIKFNWIGPGLLALIPWIAIQMSQTKTVALVRCWSYTAVVLLSIYIGILYCLSTGKPTIVYQTFFTKFIDWRDFNQQIDLIAKRAEDTFKSSVVIVPIDRYNIASELTFYQTTSHTQQHIYPIVGSDIFGYESLMYRYWSKNTDLSHSVLLLISQDPARFSQNNMMNKITALSSPDILWAHSPGSGLQVIPYYYQFAELK